MRLLPPPSMAKRVVVKWGGGLITDKTVLLTPNIDVIQTLSKQMKNVVDSGYQVILVHGAGSFGHLRAKHWKLHLGKQNQTFVPEPGIFTQEQAVEEVRRDMESLNSFVISELEEMNLDCEVFPAHKWATETGSNFEGDLAIFENSSADVIITFGDVVDCSPPAMFGILSGDDLVKRLSIELGGVERLVFAIGGVDGVLENPPGDGNEIVIPTLTKNSEFLGSHESTIDVTGGIGLKISRGFEVSDNGIEVLLVNGENSDRFEKACLGIDVIGTKIQS